MNSDLYCPTCLALFSPTWRTQFSKSELKGCEFSFMHQDNPIFLTLCPNGCKSRNTPYDGEGLRYTKAPEYLNQERTVLLDPATCEVRTEAMRVEEERIIVLLESQIERVNALAILAQSNSYTTRAITLEIGDVIETI